MSKYEHKTGRGSMFVNDKKENENDPDRKGEAKVACPHCKAEFEAWLSGWINQTKSGNPYLSVSIKAKDTTHSEGMAQAKQAAAPDDFESDQIPF